ncbi:tRNA1(Val) (adenine(37)-N6)-methyltransferase [Winogradskyella alexanderae]|uniref:tRNA1(Val) (adenine(37)-N6)-methyltransferase n=1 Tax=Winogradskyella alexanderae TaxID=2877123 RepID=A0ABS7XQ51_9FLAO|nr:methyltransferase [Winogradskyella alexanderae]MCA0131573.1 methyltransferase [Winogradskyella alexanderae]
MGKPFVFKQFSIQQDKCAMKIGTDGVLLGAWSEINHDPKTILDIGAGTGVISLMLAQRVPQSFIEAIEIDSEAFEQCTENFENSPWADRLFCYHASLLEFVEEAEDKYDLIVCNPPFYSEDYKTNNKARDLARFSDAMPFEHLIYAVARLLDDYGVFCTIIPFKEQNKFVELAKQVNLQITKHTLVRGNKDSEIKRSLLSFSFRPLPHKISEITIENKRHQYTSEYMELTKEFYLKM